MSYNFSVYEFSTLNCFTYLHTVIVSGRIHCDRKRGPHPPTVSNGDGTTTLNSVVLNGATTVTTPFRYHPFFVYCGITTVFFKGGHLRDFSKVPGSPQETGQKFDDHIAQSYTVTTVRNDSRCLEILVSLSLTTQTILNPGIGEGDETKVRIVRLVRDLHFKRING